MSKNILIVEDDEAARSGLTELLTHAGYNVLSSGTFEEGKRIMLEQTPDLLIADIRLGDFNGLQLLVDRPRFIPAIIMTGFHDEVLKAESVRLRAAYVIKPLSFLSFLAVIEHEIAKSGDDESLKI
jgi:DNA-binding response OmpR family regulator